MYTKLNPASMQREIQLCRIDGRNHKAIFGLLITHLLSVMFILNSILDDFDGASADKVMEFRDNEEKKLRGEGMESGYCFSVWGLAINVLALRNHKVIEDRDEALASDKGLGRNKLRNDGVCLGAETRSTINVQYDSPLEDYG